MLAVTFEVVLAFGKTSKYKNTGYKHSVDGSATLRGKTYNHHVSAVINTCKHLTTSYTHKTNIL